MNSKTKNNLIGFGLIAVIMVGFMVYQARQIRKTQEEQAAKAIADGLAAHQLDTTTTTVILEEEEAIPVVEETAPVIEEVAPVIEAPAQAFVEPLLEEEVAPEVILPAEPAPVDTLTLENNLFELRFLTRGAQPYSARLKEYKKYGGDDLYLYEGGNYLNFTFRRILPGSDESVQSARMDFQVDSARTDESHLVLYTEIGPGRLEQIYAIEPDSYVVDYKVAFVGLDSVITRQVRSMQMDYNITIPRLEKGIKTERQYSKLNYAFSGEEDIEDIGGTKDERVTEMAPVSWIGYQQQFFSVILRNKSGFGSGPNSFLIRYRDDALMTCMATLKLNYEGGSDYFEIPFEMYIGPNDYYTLKDLGQNYEGIIPLGGWLVGWFTKYVIIPIFHFFHDYMGILNFGLIILLMTLVIKLIVLPFAYKSYSSSAKMAALRPEIEKINAKYPKQDDAMKKQQATMDLYKRAGVSPMGGCLPMLFQFPILWAMFRFFPASIELRQQPFLWADDLSAYDNILPAGFELPFIGHLSLFALLMAVSMWFYSKVISGTQMSGTDPSAKMMKFMSIWLMPIMMFFICNSLSAGLSYYYLLSNIITMIETFIIRKWFVHPEEILARVHATEGKPVQKSKWQLRLEQAQKMQREMEEKKKQQGRK